MRKYHFQASHYARQKRRTAVADKLRSIIVRLSVIVNLNSTFNINATIANQPPSDKEDPRVECSFTSQPDYIRFEIIVNDINNFSIFL